MNFLSSTQDLMLTQSSFCSEMTAMVSGNLSQDIEPCDYLVEQKESGCLPVIFESWHSFNPLG
jgi:hypothetical protein